jgi:hypothetical protein
MSSAILTKKPDADTQLPNSRRVYVDGEQSVFMCRFVKSRRRQLATSMER